MISYLACVFGVAAFLFLAAALASRVKPTDSLPSARLEVAACIMCERITMDFADGVGPRGCTCLYDPDPENEQLQFITYRDDECPLHGDVVIQRIAIRLSELSQE